MNAKVMSIVTGTSECISKCPFCVSCEQCGGHKEPSVNWRNFKIAVNYANTHGVDTLVLTSRGEPLLYPDMITMYLVKLREYNSTASFIELQTNGILLSGSNLRNYKMNGELRSLVRSFGINIDFEGEVDLIKLWYELGLTHIALSTVSYDNKVNARNYLGYSDAKYPALEGIISMLHEYGFTVRCVCIMAHEKGFIDTFSKMLKYIDFCKQNGVEQLTFRPVNEEYRRDDAHKWVEEHKLTKNEKCYILGEIAGFEQATTLHEIPRVGYVYDIKGQNVMFSHSMTKYTNNSDYSETRQLIFFPEGRLKYEWEKDGAILL